MFLGRAFKPEPTSTFYKLPVSPQGLGTYSATNRPPIRVPLRNEVVSDTVTGCIQSRVITVISNNVGGVKHIVKRTGQDQGLAAGPGGVVLYFGFR